MDKYEIKFWNNINGNLARFRALEFCQVFWNNKRSNLARFRVLEASRYPLLSRAKGMDLLDLKSKDIFKSR